MSRLDELVDKLCPNGVKFEELRNKKLFKFYYGKGNKIPENIGGIYEVYGANGVVSHINEYNCEDVTIIGHIGAVGMINRCKGKCFVTYNGTIAEVIDKTKINTQYLYYVLTTLDLPSYKKGSQPFLSVSDFEKICIPVPPLEVQDEIVCILDDFTKLSLELKSKILEELKARQKQYNEYINIILSDNNLKEFKKIKLKDLFDFKNGLSKGKEFFGSGTPFIRYTDVYNKRFLHSEDIEQKVNCTEKELESLKVKRGDVFFTRTSEIAEQVGYSSVLLDNIENCVFNGFTIKATPKTTLLLPEYCAFCFSTNSFRQYVSTRCAFTTRASLTGKTIGEYELSVPSIQIQEKIVKQLMSLYKLVNDISEGLPAEIQARQKQYEYYRDKLLTFKELKVNEG